MNVDEKIELIKNNSVDIMGEDVLRQKFESKKSMSAYIGRAPTGSLH